MSDTLTDENVEELVKIGKTIRKGLECDANGSGLPCRSDRFSVVEEMKRYLEIHDYKIDQA